MNWQSYFDWFFPKAAKLPTTSEANEWRGKWDGRREMRESECECESEANEWQFKQTIFHPHNAHIFSRFACRRHSVLAQSLYMWLATDLLTLMNLSFLFLLLHNPNAFSSRTSYNQNPDKRLIFQQIKQNHLLFLFRLAFSPVVVVESARNTARVMVRIHRVGNDWNVFAQLHKWCTIFVHQNVRSYCSIDSKIDGHLWLQINVGDQYISLWVIF